MSLKFDLWHISFLQREAGDSSLKAICSHFLRKSVRKLNRINKSIPPHPLSDTHDVQSRIFFFLTCSSYGTTGWNRQFCWVGSILTTPERHCSGWDAVRSSTKTNLDWGGGQKNPPDKQKKKPIYLQYVPLLWKFWHGSCHTTVGGLTTHRRNTRLLLL